jgi:hypothetical protein
VYCSLAYSNHLPASLTLQDSQRTLQFALVAKTVQNKPMINQVCGQVQGTL